MSIFNIIKDIDSKVEEAKAELAKPAAAVESVASDLEAKVAALEAKLEAAVKAHSDLLQRIENFNVLQGFKKIGTGI